MHRHRGLTLVEALFAIALIGTLTAVAVPAFHGIVEQTKADTITQRLRTEIAFARNEAVFSRHQVVMCRTRDFRTCADIGVWSTGIMTFEDRNYDRDLNRNEQLLRVKTAADFGGFHLVGSLNRPVIGFRPDGRSAGSNTTLRLCSKSLKALRLVVINTGGRVRTTRATKSTPPCGSDEEPRTQR
ncbi:MAG: hypothetical protein DDT26_01247 [Dehalococcoidia bacterium]|nr:hypothetical protein [Chloroflexota bacterium]